MKKKQTKKKVARLEAWTLAHKETNIPIDGKMFCCEVSARKYRESCSFPDAIAVVKLTGTYEK